MSEKSKGDTSSVSTATHPSRVVNNPLLNASVTGLTFDDFPNGPLLLPAAPPVPQPTPPPAVIVRTIINKECKVAAVTVGKTPNIDSETLSEINLNSSSEDTSSTSSSSANANVNSNPLFEENQVLQQSDESILSQAATSFSQLPSVASSVFSTFSKRIYSNSSSRERTPVTDAPSSDLNFNPISQHDIQPSYIQQQKLQKSPSVPATFTDPPSGLEISFDSNIKGTAQYPKLQLPASQPLTQEPNQPPPEPPKFYSPTEVPFVGGGKFTSCPPSAAAGQNTYRLSVKKKIYAPIPGLLANQGQEQPPLLSTVKAASVPPYTPTACGNTFQVTGCSDEYQAPSQQEESQRNEVFSLSSIVSTAVPSVFQNITGLVQSAAGTLSTKQDSLYHQTQRHDAAPYSVLFDQSAASAAAADSEISSVPTNPFVTQTSLPTAASSYPSAEEGLFPSLSSQHNFFVPIYDPLKSVTPSGNSAGYLAQEVRQASALSPTALFTPELQSHPSLSGSIPGQQLNITETQFQPPAVTNIFETVKSSEPLLLKSFSTNVLEAKLPASSTPLLHHQQQPHTSSGQTHPQAEFITSHFSSTSQQPATALKPPTNATVHTTFRLQKGTRYYKSPFETVATAYTLPDQSQSLPQATNLNLFGLAPTSTVPGKLFDPTDSKISVQENTPSVNKASAQLEEQKQRKTEIKNCSPNLQNPNGFAPIQRIVADPLSVGQVESKSVNLIAIPDKQSEKESLPAAAHVASPNFIPNITDSNVSVETFAVTVISSKNLITSTTCSLAPPDDVPPSEPSKCLKEVNDNISEVFTDRTPNQLSLFKPTKLTTKPSVVDHNHILETALFSLPPPQNTSVNTESNPYRKGLNPPPLQVSSISASPDTLASFFVPTGDFNKFSETQNELNCLPTIPTKDHASTGVEDKAPFQPTTDISSFFNSATIVSVSAPVAFKNTKQELLSQTPFTPAELLSNSTNLRSSTSAAGTEVEDQQVQASVAASINPTPLRLAQYKSDKIDSLLEHDVLQKSTEPQQPSNVNLFSNFFGQTLSFPQQHIPDSSSFFDTISQEKPSQSTKTAAPPSVKVNNISLPLVLPEDPNSQRIQNFFNNPPPKDLDPVGDLNYDLVHSGLAVKNIQPRSLTPASNLVEPPSSSCSEFSELNNSIGLPQRQTQSADSSSQVSPEEIYSPVEPNASVRGAPTLDRNIEEENHHDLPEEILNELRMANLLTGEKGAAAAPPTIVSYNPALKHWFYNRTLDSKPIWTPFTHYDSALLETSLALGDEAPRFTAVEGGRYEVNIEERTKAPIYWTGEPTEVRRCSWFYKGVDSKYIPYDEATADLLEAEYKQSVESNEWHKKVVISMGDHVVFHGPTVIVHFQQQQTVDSWGGSSQTTARPRVVKRDLDDFIIEQGESHRVDHLLFMVHGIGSACDLKMRTVEEVVEEFRGIAQQLVQSHYKNSSEMGLVGRVEVLPVSWHSQLHSDEMGIDDKLKSITLESIPKLRNFTNDTLLDVLFYTSPTFCQKIMNTVAASMNSVYLKYRQRNPDFSGGISLAGHSLGSLILFDLLCHQKPIKEREEHNMENPDQQFLNSSSGIDPLHGTQTVSNKEVESKQISYTVGPAGTGQPFISYAQLVFQPKKFFALGSPIGMFVTIRGIDKLGLDFRLPTCPGFYNIFHPYDPVAYRIEALVNPDMSGIRPVLIPHHKGRKRMHLELKETMTRVGADLKQRFFDTFKTTIESVNFLAPKNKNDAKEMEKDVDKVLEMQVQLEQQKQQQLQQQPSDITFTRTRADSTSTIQSDNTDLIELDLSLGKLNDSKRVDYVLQEAPLEFINEYLFALSSHVCYWDSADTILFVMKEIYSGLGISPDSQVPQQSMTIERPSSRNSQAS